MATAAGSTHPTGMHSCLYFYSHSWCIVKRYLNLKGRGFHFYPGYMFLSEDNLHPI